MFLVRFVEKGPKTAKFRKIQGVPCSSVVIPRNGKGPRSGEGFPCYSVAETENLDRLGFAAAKLSYCYAAA